MNPPQSLGTCHGLGMKSWVCGLEFSEQIVNINTYKLNDATGLAFFSKILHCHHQDRGHIKNAMYRYYVPIGKTKFRMIQSQNCMLSLWMQIIVLLFIPLFIY